MALIENQRITKRVTAKKGKPSSYRHNIKSAGFDSGFMSHFDQKPAKSRKKSNASPFASVKRFAGTEKSSKRNSAKRLFEKKTREEKPYSSGFSIPIPSAATIAVVAGTVLISLTALNWEGFDIQTPQIYAFQPAIDQESSQRTLQYAATGVAELASVRPVAPGVFPSSNPERETAETQATAAEITAPIAAAAPSSAPSTSESPLPNDLITFNWQQYRVQRGDSVSSIAQKFGVSVGAVIASNEIRNARRLQEGSVLRIPNIDGIPYSVKSGDSLSRISASFNVPLEVILDVNDIRSDTIRAGETLFIPGARMNDMDLRMSLGEMFIYPLQNRHITSRFGMRKDPINGELSFHTGIDLRANTGTTVMAAMDGTVSATGENWVYGKYIILSHTNGYKTLYGHLNSFSVKQGDRVSQGRKIAESGNTGYSTGPHLHFSVYDKNNKLINPLDLLH